MDRTVAGLTFEEQYEAATASTAVKDAILPRASAVRFDPAAGHLAITFRNGAALAVPISMVPEVAGADADRVANVRAAAAGDAIEWPSLDVHIDLVGLLIDVFGSEAWIREMARRVGARTSEKKKKASAENGKKGGRPPRKAG